MTKVFESEGLPTGIRLRWLDKQKWTGFSVPQIDEISQTRTEVVLTHDEACEARDELIRVYGLPASMGADTNG